MTATNKNEAIKASVWCLHHAIEHLQKEHKEKPMKTEERNAHAMRLVAACGEHGVVNTVGELRTALFMALDGQEEDDEIRKSVSDVLSEFNSSTRVFGAKKKKGA